MSHDEEFNLEYTKKVKKMPNDDLESLLNLLTKDNLQIIYDETVSEEVKSSIKKSELIKKICDFYSDKNNIDKNITL